MSGLFLLVFLIKNLKRCEATLELKRCKTPLELKRCKTNLDVITKNRNQKIVKQQNDIKIKCQSGEVVILNYDEWRKYHYFTNLKENSWLELRKPEIPQIFEYKFLKHLSELTVKNNLDPISPDTFLNIIRILDYYILKDEYCLDIFENLLVRVMNGIYNDKCIGKIVCDNTIINLYLFCKLYPNFFDQFWPRVFAHFEVNCIMNNSIVELKNKSCKFPFTEYKLDRKKAKGLTVNLFIFDKHKTEDTLKTFIEVFKVFIKGLLERNPREDKIESINIIGTCTREHLKILNDVFESNDQIKNFILDGMYKRYKTGLFEREKYLKFLLGKFTSLNKFEITIGAFISGRALRYILKNEKVIENLSGLTIINNSNILDNVGERISKLGSLRKLYLSECMTGPSALCSIFRKNRFVSSLQELTLINIRGFKRFQAKEIRKFEKLESLTLKFCSIEPEDLTIILESENIRNTLKELRVHDDIYETHIDCIIHLRSLVRLDIFKANYYEINHMKILNDVNFIRNLREYTISHKSGRPNEIPKQHLLNLNSLDVLDCHCPSFFPVPSSIFSKVNWETNIKTLILREVIFFGINHYDFISRFVNLKTLEIYGGHRPFRIPTRNNLNLIKSKNLVKRLHLSIFSNVTRGNAWFILQFELLEEMSLEECRIEEIALSEILRSEFLKKSLKKIRLKGIIGFTNHHAELLSEFENLETLELAGCTSFKNIHEILNSKKLRKTVKKLDLSKNTDISNNEMGMISKFEILEVLVLRYCGLAYSHLSTIYENEKFSFVLREIWVDGNFDFFKHHGWKELDKFKKREILVEYN